MNISFMVVSYNQENLIIETLESIKYQIQLFGNDNSIQLVIADDCSCDKTILNSKIWIERNKNLFSDSKIIMQKENSGIVNNYLSGINGSDGEFIFQIAGDDLFFINNIFSYLKYEFDLMITPVVPFISKQIDFVKSALFLQGFHILLKNNSLKRLRKSQYYGNFIPAPGTLIRKSVLTDPHLQTFQRKFKYSEDYSQWYYLFNLYNKELEIKFDFRTIRLYRSNTGVSITGKENHEINAERDKMRTEFHLSKNYFKYPKVINPYVYYWKCLKIKWMLIDFIFLSEHRELEKEYIRSLNEVPSYLAKNKERAINFFYQLDDWKRLGE